MRVRKGFAGATLVAALGWTCAAEAAATAAQKCEAAKNDVAGKYVACLGKAEKGLVGTGDTARYAAAVALCGQKYADKWQSIEDKAGLGICPSEGDEAAVQAYLDACQQGLAEAVSGGSLPSDVVSCNADLLACSGDLATATADLGVCTADLGDCDADLGAATTDLGACNTNLTATNADLGACNASLASATADLGTCNTNLTTTNADLGTCNGNLSTTNADLGACNSDLGACSSDLGDCSADLGVATADLGTCNTNLTTTNADLGTCNGNLSTTNADLGACNSDLGACTADLGTCDANLSATNADLGDCNTDLGAANADLTACDADLASCEAALAVKLPRTNQTACVDYIGSSVPCAGSYTDGETQAGNARSFSDNGDGTITDNATGLMWEKQSDDGTLHDKDYAGSWGAVIARIDNLNSTQFAGHSDWRLPNITELETLRDFGAAGRPVFAAFDTNCTPGCTVLTCSCTRSYYYWSSTARTDNTGENWTIHFGFGTSSFQGKTGSLAIRAVRGGL